MGCPDPRRFEALAAGQVPTEERGALLDHAAGCRECHAVMAVFESGGTRTRTTGPGDTDAGSAPTVHASQPSGARSTTDEPPPRPGDRVGRYVLTRLLGAGAMGVVFAARDPELDREVALKLLRPGASDERLRREAQALAKLAHPHVVRIYDVGEHGGRTFIAMELVDGDNLRRWLLTPRTTEQILDVLLRAGQGLAAAHRAGLIHRDLKPDNILVASDGNVLVGDFGLARTAVAPELDGADAADAAADPTLTATGTLLGTPAYMAPEQASGDATAASDQYAFCVTAWEAWFGRRPVTGGSIEELLANARAGKLEKPADRALPARLEQALRRGLAPAAADRFPSMDALLAALAPPRRRRGWIVAGAAVAVALPVATFVALRRPAATAAPCAGVGDAIAAVWTGPARATASERGGEALAKALDGYTGAWRTMRIEVCEAGHRKEQRVETVEARVACLDRARNELAVILDLAGGPATASFADPTAVLAGLPPVDRCGPGLSPDRRPPPPAASAADIATLDKALTALNLEVIGGSQGLEPANASALRSRAETLGYPPQIVRALLVEAAVLDWNGDLAGAERGLRRAAVEAEKIQDDLARVDAAAQLARVQVKRDQLDDAANTIAGARAVLGRVAPDATVDANLTRAEVALARARRDDRGAALLQERVVAIFNAQYGPHSPLTIQAELDLGPLWSGAGDYARGKAAVDKAMADDDSDFLANLPFMAEDPNEALTKGDFAAAIAIDHRRLAALRGLPAPMHLNLGYALKGLAMDYELDGDFAACARYAAEAVAEVDRPLAEFESDVEKPDPVGRLRLLQESLDGGGRCLYRVGRFAEAVTYLRRAVATGDQGDAIATEDLRFSELWLARALAATGAYREARERIERVRTWLVDYAQPVPYGRGIAAFTLAQALWEDGDQRDRIRALTLADDAERHFGDAITAAADRPPVRKLITVYRDEREAVKAWKAKRAR